MRAQRKKRYTLQIRLNLGWTKTKRGGVMVLGVVSRAPEQPAGWESHDWVEQSWGDAPSPDRVPTLSDLRRSKFFVLTDLDGFVEVKLTDAELKRFDADPGVVVRKAMDIADRVNAGKKA